MRGIALALILILSGSATANDVIVRLLNNPFPGGVAVIPLEMDPTPRVHYQNKPVLVIRNDQQQPLAIVGIPLSVTPGSQHIEVQYSHRVQTLGFQVNPREYNAQHITLKNTQHVNPDPENLKRINRELEEQNRAYRQFSANTPSNLRFDKPVDGPLSSPFGLRRFFNGEERNPHSGLDFAVPQGTPVKSPAAGRVILTGHYFFNGNTVFVDHGQGLISMFCHLSRIDVKTGDDLPRSGVLGLVGATGRATGPHLHWNVSLNDARVDPAIFIGAVKP